MSPNLGYIEVLGTRVVEGFVVTEDIIRKMKRKKNYRLQLKLTDR